MKFSYYWRDYNNVDHWTADQKEADRALHSGYTVFLQPMDKKHRDGTDRAGM